MKEYKDDGFHMYIDDGIVFIEWLKSDYKYEDVDNAIKMRLELTGNKDYPMFSDIRKVKLGTREARQRLSHKDAGLGVKAVGILMDSKVQQVMFNFFNAVYKSPAPNRIFSNKEAAVKWLQKYKDVENAGD